MDTDEHGYIAEKHTHAIIGCAMAVLNELGHGLLEKPYENALTVEFQAKDIPYVQQLRFKVLYKSVQVGEYIPDLIAYDQIIIETKVIEKITDHEVGQLVNYLKVTGLKVGLIFNFKRSRLEWKRIVL